MLTLRNEQMDAFDAADGSLFRGYMVEHLEAFSPLHFQTLGQDGIAAIIDTGIERAKRYGLTRHGPVQLFIELFFLIGIDFDTDPQYHQLHARLTDMSVTDEVERADRLFDEVMRYLDLVGGPERGFTKRALRRASELPYEGIPTSVSNYDDLMLQRLYEMRPEKLNYVGTDALRVLLARAREEAARYAITSSAGLALITGLMYALGHGVIRDPKYPFMEPTLLREGSPPNERAERLYKKTMTYLTHVLQHLDR
jgi:hypothetical protein